MRRQNIRFRKKQIVFSAALALVSVYLGLSIAASLFALPFPSLPGKYFAAAFGILAFFIPGVLFWAAILLADPRYRPDKIFLLGFAFLPFMTLVLGFVLLKDFSFYAGVYSILNSAGRAGLSFAVIFLTILELSALALLRSLLFKTGAEAEQAEQTEAAAGQETGASQHRYIPILPPPGGTDDRYTWRADTDISLTDISLAKTGEFERSGPDDAEEAESAGDFGAVLYADNGETGELEVLEPLDDEIETLESGGAGEGLEPSAVLDAETGDDLERALSEAEEKAQLKTRAREAQGKQNEDGDRKRKARRGPYQVPVEGLLTQYPDGEYWIIDQATRDAAHTLKGTLEEFHIQAEVTGIRKGPVITMFEILPAPGVKLSRIVNLQDNIALRLAASSVRIVAPIPGKHAVGIEVPNQKRNIVSFREIIEGELAGGNSRKMGIPVVLGKDITGEAQTIDLVQTPHLLIAGATGSGKSVCVNSMILSILYQLPPQECRLILIDPKIVELKLYNDIPHLLTPVITEPKKAFQALQYCIYEMERRYACLDSMGVRDIKSYNRRIKERNIAAEHIPYIVVVIDEFADLMATTGKELESTVARLAAMSRAVGVHLVLATQRPSIDVITGLIKANIPTRIAFMVASKMDSRIIIDMVGAEKLLGKGDMLYAGVVDPFPIRMQGAFVSEEEVERVVDYVKSLGEPEYIDEEIFFDDEEDSGPSLFADGDDPLYDKALEIVMQQGKASASYIQRRLKIGYNRAARLVEEMEHKGIVGPAQGSRPRELIRGV
ncbi:MAG: DNA translocase FtsK [Spirochaetaceae bacterium]|jgi:S-DNA-T family DNA segregation ATPase FtsK/SpoIIIE|nr:DNA translocase FtsK [Spirochaetaceae bacterium]